jgi:hypothetical protein
LPDQSSQISLQPVPETQEKIPKRELQVILEQSVDLQQLFEKSPQSFKAYPHKPEIGDYQDKNEKDHNKLLHLGGGEESWDKANDGKKKVEGNINMKPSKVETLYNFD